MWCLRMYSRNFRGSVRKKLWLSSSLCRAAPEPDLRPSSGFLYGVGMWVQARSRDDPLGTASLLGHKFGSNADVRIAAGKLSVALSSQIKRSSRRSCSQHKPAQVSNTVLDHAEEALRRCFEKTKEFQKHESLGSLGGLWRCSGFTLRCAEEMRRIETLSQNAVLVIVLFCQA